jgi:hypothetical protein
MQTFGYPIQTWQAAKDQIKEVLVERARTQQTIAYSDLVQRINAIDLEAQDPRLDELLFQVAADESSQGRGMLSVLVVHKSGDFRPGRGFYKCAASLGLDASDEERLWGEQLHVVYSSWARPLVPRSD